MRKPVIIASLAAALALALVACSGGGGSGAAETAEGTSVEQLSASAVRVTLDSSSDAAVFEVTVNEGEAYTMASSLSEGEAEVLIALPEGDTTDYAYEGYGVGWYGIEAGTYSVTVKPTDASGTIYILSYDSDQLDFESFESEELFEQIAASVA